MMGRQSDMLIFQSQIFCKWWVELAGPNMINMGKPLFLFMNQKRASTRRFIVAAVCLKLSVWLDFFFYFFFLIAWTIDKFDYHAVPVWTISSRKQSEGAIAWSFQCRDSHWNNFSQGGCYALPYLDLLVPETGSNFSDTSSILMSLLFPPVKCDELFIVFSYFVLCFGVHQEAGLYLMFSTMFTHYQCTKLWSL